MGYRCQPDVEYIFGSLDVEKDVSEALDGVAVPAHHEVGEADVVVHRDLTARHWRPCHACKLRWQTLKLSMKCSICSKPLEIKHQLV